VLSTALLDGGFVEIEGSFDAGGGVDRVAGEILLGKMGKLGSRGRVMLWGELSYLEASVDYVGGLCFFEFHWCRSRSCKDIERQSAE
jgi:hypothetical protein